MINEILTLKNLNVGFSDVLIENLNISLTAPKVISLMGKNGIGKSCLLKTISGLIEPIAGEVLVRDINISQYSSLELAQNIAILLTDRINVDFLSVEELVLLGRSPYTNWNNDYTAEDSKIVHDLLNLLDLHKLKDKFFINLSDGQKQKVLLARALAQTPKILLLDEPTTFLDIPSKIDFLKHIKNISIEKDVIILMSTHETILMNEIVDEIWLVDDKKVVCNSPAEIQRSGLFKKSFGLDLY